MENAIKEVKENGLSIKQAAFLCGVNRTTLMNHLKQYRCGAVGRPTLLTQAEEGMIVHALKKLGEWAFFFYREKSPTEEVMSSSPLISGLLHGWKRPTEEVMSSSPFNSGLLHGWKRPTEEVDDRTCSLFITSV